MNNSYIYIYHVNVTQTVPDISPLMPMHQDPLLVSKPLVNSNWSYSPETPKIFVPCDHENWQMTLKNYKTHFLCYFKLCASFHSHQWSQTGVRVRKRQIRVKIDYIFICVQAATNTSFCLSVCLSVTPFSLCSCHRIIMKFSGVIAIDKTDVHARGQGQRSKVKVTEVKIFWFWPKLGASGLYLQFEFTNGDEMMHKAWSRFGEVPYCFSRSSVKSQGHTTKTIVDFYPNWAFPDCNSSLIHRWLWNDAQSLKWHRRGALFCFKVIHQISRSHGTENRRFWPELSVSGL